MIYDHSDNHPIVKAIKSKGWVIFMVAGARVTEKNGIYGGYWIDCYEAHGTIHEISHKMIHGYCLGNTMRDALQEIKSGRFPSRTDLTN